MSDRKTPTFDRSLVEGPLSGAIWKIVWPTLLQNIVAGLQGLVDHIMVGRFVGFEANAAIGVSWQIFLVVVVFIASLYSGMGVLVARLVGAHEPEKVNRVVFQVFLLSLVIGVCVFPPLGFFLSPMLLELVNAQPGWWPKPFPICGRSSASVLACCFFSCWPVPCAPPETPRHPSSSASR